MLKTMLSAYTAKVFLSCFPVQISKIHLLKQNDFKYYSFPINVKQDKMSANVVRKIRENKII